MVPIIGVGKPNNNNNVSALQLNENKYNSTGNTENNLSVWFVNKNQRKRKEDLQLGKLNIFGHNS